MLEAEPDLIQDLREDLLVSTMRDSSIPSLLAAFLFSKGYHAVATYRISHVIYKYVVEGGKGGRRRCMDGSSTKWPFILTHTRAPIPNSQGRESLSRYLQSLNSELFGADIHPACTIGRVRVFVVDGLMDGSAARAILPHITTTTVLNPPTGLLPLERDLRGDRGDGAARR